MVEITSPDVRKGLRLSALSRAYRCRAELSNGDVHLIITDDKKRVINYLALLCKSPGYREVCIECGNKKYTAENLRGLP